MVQKIPHGVARYVTQLARALNGIRQKQALPYEPIFLIHVDFVNQVHMTPFKDFRTHVMQHPYLSLKELSEIPRALKLLEASVYHSPSFSSLWNSPCRSVITIHDLNHLTYGNLAKKIYYRTILRRFALRSNVIATVSEYSRREISKWLRYPEDWIELVYNVLDPPPSLDSDAKGADEALLKSHGLRPGQYFISLSNPKPHKNLPLLVSAYEIFRRQQAKAWPLVLSVREYQNKPGILSLGGLPDEVAQVLLRNAAGMLFPSLYEGFGLPPVEAVLSGVPIAVSEIPAHREGLSDLSPGEVLWVDPQDFHGWVQAFHRLQRGEVSSVSEDRKKLILNRYSLKRMGRDMDRIYRSVLEVKS